MTLANRFHITKKNNQCQLRDFSAQHSIRYATCSKERGGGGISNNTSNYMLFNIPLANQLIHILHTTYDLINIKYEVNSYLWSISQITKEITFRHLCSRRRVKKNSENPINKNKIIVAFLQQCTRHLLALKHNWWM